MALSLSFPSSRTDSGQSIFETCTPESEVAVASRKVEKECESVSESAAISANRKSEEKEKQKKPWKSTPSLNLKGSAKSPDEVKHSRVVPIKPGGSFIPVPVSSKRASKEEKSGLTLENLINSNSSANKGLPDVTESPQTPFQNDKPCDLLAQLEIVKRQREMEIESSTGRDSRESDSVDDNGNPLEMSGEEGEMTGSGGSGVADDEKDSTDDLAQVTDKTPPATSLTLQEESSEATSLEDRHNKTPTSSSADNSDRTPIPFSLPHEKSPDEPKYFINAAALSEDNFELPPSPAPSPCSSHFSSLNFVDPYPSLCPFVPESKAQTEKAEMSLEKALKKSGIPKKGMKIVTPQQERSAPLPPSKDVVRPRVPVSKSFPDIVQTTFGGATEADDHDGHPLSGKTTKDNSDTESLVADSLEELRQEPPEKRSASDGTVRKQPEVEAEKPLKAFEQPLPSYAAFDPMTESQIGGISAEKPPEAWVIDFNSLSLDSDLMTESSASQRERKSSMSSNPSSLAFFVNLDNKSEAAGGDSKNVAGASGSSQEASQQSATATPDKKIFTMFVDLGNESEEAGGSRESQIPQLQRSSDSESLMSVSMTLGSGSSGNKRASIINKPVKNIMETSVCGNKYPVNRRFPSPIFQHRAAAEASRKAARMEMHKERDKPHGHGHSKEQFLDSLEPHSTAFMQMPPRNNDGVCGGGGPPEVMLKSQLIDSTSSNRSSLHVANVLDASFTSSLLSSMENSSPTDMEVCQGGPCFKLGKDLLRMFQDGINPDVNIVVNGKCIKAHKCILASRSQYFAAILSGNWVECAGNTINLDGFSYTVVQFTMYHIYSGTNEIPDTIDLLELATLTDLLGLEGLRENISQTIRAKFCHNFHRPCTGCISGVIECFPIAIAYGMDELHRKMTKWICKHFVRIWPTKAFANLGDELIEKCLRYSVNHMSVDNILDHTLGCDQLLTTMPTVRWTEPIFSIVGQLSEACVQYIGEHFCEVLQSDKFLLFGKGQTWNISRIEGTFMEALNLLKPDEACLSHTALARLIELGTIDEVEWSTLFVDFLKMLRGEIERYLLANASKAVLSKCWEQLGQDVRKKICTSSFMGYDKFGNKIVKNQGSGHGGGHGGGHHHQQTTTTVPVQNVKPTTKEQRPSGYGSKSSKAASKQMSVPITTTVTKEPNKEPILSPMTTNPAKVASVRPMQAQAQPAAKPPVGGTNSRPPVTAPAVSNARATSSAAKPRSSSSSSAQGTVEPRENKTLSRVSAHKSFTPPPAGHTRASGSVPRKFTSAEREKSFNNSPRAAHSTSSASRTPMKPLTPSKTDSPIIQHGTGQYSRTTAAATARRAAKAQPPPPSNKGNVPPTKIFLTNSAKAAAVSKPNLKGSVVSAVSKRTPSSSATSLHSQQSTASSRNSTHGGNSHGSQIHPRYLNTKESSGHLKAGGGFSARSSFSNVERPGVVKPKPVPERTQRRNTYSNNIQAGNKNNASGAGGPATASGSGGNKRPLSGGNIGGNVVIPNSAKSGSGAHVPANRNMTEMQNNYAKDNVMSKSTIETDSGETKMRTLAEIGRSSTFSKDEPTILGKMDGSTYGTLDMEISP